MRVLALDPGYDRLGAAVLEMQNGKEHVLLSTCITTRKTDTLPERLRDVGVALEQILETYHPHTLALETLFFNKNAKTAIGVAEARGICIYLGVRHGCTILEYSPQQVKAATTGYGNSDKAAVTSMIKRLVVGVPETAHDDEYDAIAVGVTALAHNRTT
jgi:crossover junction endodeoxyribonuclease RuvC